ARLPLRAAVVNGTCETDWPDVAALCRGDVSANDGSPRLIPSFGLHPWHVGNASPDWRGTLLAQFESPRESRTTSAPTVAVGEIGLDRWMLDRARPDDPRLAGLRRASLAEQRDA